MKIHELIITRNFLLHLRNQHQNEQLLPLTDVFATIFSREELLAIIDHMTEGISDPEHPNFEECEKHELLTFIADQYYVLDYIISRIEEHIGI